MTIDEFYSLPEASRRLELRRCCGSPRWVDSMIAKPRADNLQQLLDQAEAAWNNCTTSDWKKAFRHHPKIGDVESLNKKFASTAQWATGEQAGFRTASSQVITSLAEGNRIYEDKFGFIFIVCATGKSAEEMLELLQQRLTNSKETELRIAAQEQLKITKLRLQKLFTS